MGVIIIEDMEISRNNTHIHIPVSLGLTTLRANEQKGMPIVIGSFITPEPTILMSKPEEEWYLNMLVAPSLRNGETGVITKLPPGVKDYYIQLGLLNKETRVVEVAPSELHKSETSIYSYRNTDPLVLLRDSFFTGINNAKLVSFFNSPAIHEEANRLGIGMIENPPSTTTNNKANIRNPSIIAKYGFNMLRGVILTREEELDRLVSCFSPYVEGIWLKLALGSGGDYVTHIKNVSKSTIIEARNNMYDTAKNFFYNGGFSDKFSSFWAEKEFAPQGFPFVVEIDVKNIGKAINGSTQFITHKNGKVDVVFHSEQITSPEGEYLGSRPLISKDYEMTKLLTDVLRKEAEKVGRYNINENGYYGIQGIDWFIVENGSKIEYYLTELNSRPIITTPAMIVAQKLGFPNWINTDVTVESPIRTIKDYREEVGRMHTDPRNLRTGRGIVVPIAFRTLTTSRGEQIPSTQFKVLVCGRSHAECENIMADMVKNKISFN